MGVCRSLCAAGPVATSDYIYQYETAILCGVWEFNERTYRYDYHASLFLARKSYARIVVKTTLLVSFSKPFLKTRNRIFVAILSEVSNSISNNTIPLIIRKSKGHYNNLVDNFPVQEGGSYDPGARLDIRWIRQIY